MTPVFLLGGGWNPAAAAQTYGTVLEAITSDGSRRLAIVVAEEPGVDPHARFVQTRGVFESVGLAAGEARAVIVSAAAPLSVATLAEAAPTGLFVCGGLTPAYYAALCGDRSWLDYVRSRRVPYAGFSAGAMIAASQAIVGGRQRSVDGSVVAIGSDETSEGLTWLDVRPGLGLVPFCVDVHAGQTGTLTRVVHALEQQGAELGWAIDEDTMLAVTNGSISVHGLGLAYRVRRLQGHHEVELFHAGTHGVTA